MKLFFEGSTDKSEVFEKVQSFINSAMRIRSFDSERPWGGFLVIDEEDTDIFIQKYFPHLTKDDLGISGKLSPKILIVAPGKRLSWQYHHRRAEIWKLIGGTAAVITSDTDHEGQKQLLSEGDIVELKQGERHRLIGTSNWGILAEIWRHTNVNEPSDENDIVRVQDDFGR